MAADGDALTSKEMRFGARLAHTEKVVRDKAVANLSAFLASREDMSELELLKVWKGLFYCMWMADKMPVQNELSERLAHLVHDFQGDLGLQFVRTFFATMEREWGGIDVLRMDKFYYLIRRVLRELFEYVRQREWAPETVQEVAGLLANGPMRLPMSSAAPSSVKEERQAALATAEGSKKTGKKKMKKVKSEFSWTMPDTRDTNVKWVPAPRGLCYHIIDVVWTELRAVCGNVVPVATYPIMDVLVMLCAFSPDRVAPTRVANKLLEPLVDPEVAEGETVPFAVRNPHIVAMSTRASNRDLLYDQWDQFKQFAAYLQRIEVNEDAATADEEQSPDEPQPKKERKSKRKGESAAKNKAKKQSKGVLAEDDTEAKPRKKRKK